MTYLQVWSRGEFFVREDIGKLFSGLCLVSLVLATCPKNRGDILERPRLDVIVACIPPMDISLDRISFVADDKAVVS